MTYRIGDTVFLSQGQPVLAAGRDETKGTVILDRDFESIRKNARHGYINGIAPENREKFLGIMDEVKKHKEPQKRIEELQKRIEELDADPKNFQFVKYLESERNHIVNMSGYQPRFYSSDESKLR